MYEFLIFLYFSYIGCELYIWEEFFLMNKQ